MAAALLGPVPAQAASGHATTYSVKDLGTLGNPAFGSTARAISGPIVVGISATPSGTGFHAFAYSLETGR